jgi:hypothetical protein
MHKSIAGKNQEVIAGGYRIELRDYKSRRAGSWRAQFLYNLLSVFDILLSVALFAARVSLYGKTTIKWKRILLYS